MCCLDPRNKRRKYHFEKQSPSLSDQCHITLGRSARSEPVEISVIGQTTPNGRMDWIRQRLIRSLFYIWVCFSGGGGMINGDGWFNTSLFCLRLNSGLMTRSCCVFLFHDKCYKIKFIGGTACFKKLLSSGESSYLGVSNFNATISRKFLSKGAIIPEEYT